MFKSLSKSKAGKALFYIFEISALVLGLLLFVIAIYNASKASSFMVFLNGFVSMIFYTLALFGIGKICDVLISKNE